MKLENSQFRTAYCLQYTRQDMVFGFLTVILAQGSRDWLSKLYSLVSHDSNHKYQNLPSMGMEL